MCSVEVLKSWVERAPHPYYFRPFVSKSPSSKGNVFIVGINPATPMHKDDFASAEEYIDTFCHREQFLERVKMIRRSQGKTDLSRTRIGLNKFVEDLELRANGEVEVIETNMNAYPTRRAKDLLSVNPDLIQYGNRVFRELLFTYRPKVIIVHSKQALGELLDLLEEEHMVPRQTFNRNLRLCDWIAKGPIPFTYRDGGIGTVLCSKHFMYHGNLGMSFQPLKEQVLQAFKQ
ncbi:MULTISPECIES: hypothetical protein [unclassified Exiguobacterium]|uniref:hypothetical protein n=1 Tax=unclassified Exiguobacterium TaxID=2644629 RepID=UPI00103BD7AE|nr:MULTISPECIES: hypothetical protein [unclassified Exiguobacterium]TCI33505.1 hypothetical protein EVJ29_13985 [Exiguobacterium sp. SH4S7]TCI42820.1 hypothetical protein EVJ31_13710 [Exiguobacterium sp. SH5S32]TCI50167.1 hypothetical protein EVJ25_12450 [Exiguobacterium sp. SH1S4]TCI53011.1 hypothetical protein EVJ24_10825 [Exiguobacterium sp. SH1S21]TCI67544.1 hypothetical protein EVJ23_13700 [Exiguobacterium sp. SH1S1]